MMDGSDKNPRSWKLPLPGICYLSVPFPQCAPCILCVLCGFIAKVQRNLKALTRSLGFSILNHRGHGEGTEDRKGRILILSIEL